MQIAPEVCCAHPVMTELEFILVWEANSSVCYFKQFSQRGKAKPRMQPFNFWCQMLMRAVGQSGSGSSFLLEVSQQCELTDVSGSAPKSFGYRVIMARDRGPICALQGIVLSASPSFMGSIRDLCK